MLFRSVTEMTLPGRLTRRALLVAPVAVAGFARAQGARVTHMSFHGALGNMAAADAELAAPLVAAVARFDPDLTILTSPSRAIEDAAAAHGLRIAKTFLADRACDRDGLLVPRRLPGAVIHDEALVLEPALDFISAMEAPLAKSPNWASQSTSAFFAQLSSRTQIPLLHIQITMNQRQRIDYRY